MKEVGSMFKHNSSISFVIGVIIFVLICGVAGQARAQWLYPLNPYLGINPYFLSYPPLPYYYSPAAITPYPSFISPLLASPVLPPRIGAATLIITNPTAGTVSVINPTVAAAPTVTTASPPQLLSLLGTLYASALYEGLLSTANPLLFALLQNLFM